MPNQGKIRLEHDEIAMFISLGFSNGLDNHPDGELFFKETQSWPKERQEAALDGLEAKGLKMNRNPGLA